MRALVLNPERAHVRHRAPTRPEPARHGLQDRIGNSGVLSALQRSRPSAISRGSQPLDSNVRRHLESSFGHDFGGVRLRADADADRAARGRGALAYTHGNEITVRPRALSSDAAGLGVLAHELAHVVQQGAAPPLDRDVRSSIGRPSAAAREGAEREADVAASVASSGGTVAGLSPAPSSVQLTKGPTCGPSSDVNALAGDVQAWVDSLSAYYGYTGPSGTSMHSGMNTALVDFADPRLMTEVTLDPAGYVLDFGEGPSSVASVRSAMEMDVETSGGYFRSVDAVIIIDEDPAVIEAIRNGTLPVTGRAIPIDHKFGGARVNKAGEAAIEEMFGTRTIACRPGGDLAGEVGWVRMEMQMSGEPLPPLSQSSAATAVPPEPVPIAVEPLEGAVVEGAALEGAAVEGAGIEPIEAPAAAETGAGMGLRGVAGAAGTALGVLGVIDMAVQMHESGCVGTITLENSAGEVEEKPLCLGGEATVAYGIREEKLRATSIVKAMSSAEAEKTLKEGEYFIKRGDIWELDELWQIVGGHAQDTGYRSFHTRDFTRVTKVPILPEEA